MEEEIQEEKEDKPKRYYKIEVGDVIVVYRDDIISGENQYTFYSTKIKRKFKSGKSIEFKKELSFPIDTNLATGTLIKVLDFYEDARIDKKNKYYPIWKLCIRDYEVVQEANAYRTEQDEIESYQAEEEFY